MKNLYIVNKYIMARTAEEALKLEKKTKPTEVYVHSEFMKHKVEKVVDKVFYKR